MEAIDDYANENIARSLAYTILEYRQQHNFVSLLPISTTLLRQRVHFLGPTSQTDPSEWNEVVQWQKDRCPEVIEALWTGDGTTVDDLYQSTVYYQRLDAETLHAVVEFAHREKKHFVVVLALEQGAEEISELKYHNTREYSDTEWKDIQTWPQTHEEAERLFLTKVTQLHRSHLTATPESTKSNREAPTGYWGDWSSDEEGQDKEECKKEKEKSKTDKTTAEEDSEEEYYTRWSRDPGTLTPPQINPEEQQEMEEEYDQSYNPLFTVPSVPNLMDAHTVALAELTQMLQTSLPGKTSQGGVSSNPLPKIISRIQDDSDSQICRVPGAYPETPQPTVEDLKTISNEVSSGWDHQKKEAGRILLKKSLSALVGAGRLLGYEGSEILDMVREIVQAP
ncbi:hypothetical protein DFQ28_002220 [Apophysomyces sp. BC1034]|nr:hypothetical protein DFQ29_001864 [Apophysomyces sp. BC1021]KAG0167592.1 hypothetical protein DFQ30_005873 [Apophysomyces sp. BC1015]KAG0181972.1 hypothetical protein DFQ28_002220 [Apophysomyces sp. BC1034]